MSVGFNQPLSTNAATLGALKVFSAQTSGQKAGTATVSGNTLSFNPSAGFKAGETVYATVTAAQSVSGTAATPHIFQFTTATSPSTGTFSGGSEVAISGELYAAYKGLTVGDLDDNGDLDAVGLNGVNTVLVRLNDGAGNFAGGQPVGDAASVLINDIDGDGDLDILTRNRRQFTGPIPNSVSMRLNQNGALLQLVSVSPTSGPLPILRNMPVTVNFNQALSTNTATQQALKVLGTQAGGKKAGTNAVTAGSIQFTPTRISSQAKPFLPLRRRPCKVVLGQPRRNPTSFNSQGLLSAGKAGA